MLLPFSVKIGPVEIEISNRATESNQLSAASMDFEYARKCWDELKHFVDKIFDGEMNRHCSKITQTGKTKLAIEILNALGKQAVEENLFTKELIKTGKFSKEEAGNFVNEAISQGIIHPGEDGFYAINRISAQ
jgi:ketol-acid reductoisomerase